MELVNGIGMNPADITDNQKSVVSAIVYDGFKEENKTCNNLQEIADYHLQCLLDLKSSKLYSAPETMITNSQEDNSLARWESDFN
jgi:hypothetical protein